ncbi:MAG: hypothetical protein JJE03_03945 [Peptostreptococcaceae bacterium]|nr:hypothetical protein [Peptostreptococcaceae bacterium]
MKVYDKVINETFKILEPYNMKELAVNSNVEWKCLENNEFLMGKEVAFELGDRLAPCTVYNCPTSKEIFVTEDRITLIGKDISEINSDTNFSRITFIDIDDVDDPNIAYTRIKRLEFERFKVIPEGYMILTSSVENKENIRVSKKAIKNGLDFSIIGNLFINRYKKIPGVNHVWMIFIVGDHPMIPELVKQSREVDSITNAFEHVMKNIITDCSICPLQTICDDVEVLRELHFKSVKEKKELEKQTEQSQEGSKPKWFKKEKEGK